MMLYDVVLRGMRTSSICYFKAPVNKFYVLQHIATRAANHVEHIVHDNNITLKCLAFGHLLQNVAQHELAVLQYAALNKYKALDSLKT